MKIVLTAGLVAMAARIATAQELAIQVPRGDGRGGETPCVLPVETPIAPGVYAMATETSGTSVSAVVFEDEGRRWIAAVLPAGRAGEAASYRLERPVPVANPGPGGVHFRPSGANLHVLVDDALLTTYIPMSNNKPIFFPVIGPTGDEVTRSYPMEDVAGEDRDHPHHRSFWFTHGSVNGVDFWAEDRPGTPSNKKTKGTIRETDRKVVVEGPVLARLRTRDDWLAPDGHRVCRDVRTATFYRTRSVRIIDFAIAIEASDGPVTFGDTKEGMFGLRVASSMDAKKKDGGKITNAEGLTDVPTWGKASPWVDYVGPVKGRTLGIAILNHPSSFRYPTTWHVRDYGLFAANPFGWKDFGRTTPGDHTLPAGETLRFAYRIILHEGDNASNDVAGWFRSYAEPPALAHRGR